METSEQLNELAPALAKAQGEIKGALKDATNPFFKSKYATLDAVWDACRGPLSANGLSIVQAPSTPHEATVCVTTLLLHASGQWIRESLTLPAGEGGPQETGSALTYARRYGLSAMVGVAPEDDDDANAAQGAQRLPPASRRVYSPAKGPTHGPDAVNAGLPVPPPTPEQEAATAKEARVLFPTADERAERDKYIAELKRLKFVLGMSDADALKVSITYVGKGVPLVTADLPDLAAMVDFMRQKAGLPKFSLSGGEAAVKGGTQ